VRPHECIRRHGGETMIRFESFIETAGSEASGVNGTASGTSPA
jgi:hypothetical protein